MFRNVFQSLAAKYSYCINNHPMATNAFTGFTLAYAGDVLCQYYEQKFERNLHLEQSQAALSDVDISDNSAIAVAEPPPFTFLPDHNRSFNMGFIRAAVIVPFITVYYPWLVYMVPGTSLPRVLARVGLDQLTGSPAVITLVFGSNAILKWTGWEAFTHRLVEQGPSAWVAGAQYWPIVHTFNFGLVPLKHQALVAHVFSLYWNAILSYYSFKNKKEAKPQSANDTELREVV